jgi:[ribosomal protein S5]-alanine N-acetyltransferase
VFELRPFEDRDVPLVLEASGDPLIPPITTVPCPCSEAAALLFIERQHERLRGGQGYSLAIANPAGQATGQIGLWPQQHGRASVGYWVVGSGRGQGAATQALQAISRFGLMSVGLGRLELYVEPWNEASWRTAERAGYRREGLMREYQPVGGVRRDMYLYSLLWSDLPPAPH